jgi:hypothetical protein
MSLQETKDHLLQLLSDEENKVIALSGKWGTGKSHLWGEVKDASKDEKVKGALYVSLFGLSGIEQMKKKLIETVVPGAEAHPALWEGAKQAVSSGVKVLEGFHKGFGAINDLSLLFAPAMLRNKVIVIDDIERKHERLSIDEVLGFIDEFSQQHGSRFVLILNSDQLAKRGVWDTLREKVVDQEIRLETSTAEAFGIAIGLTESRYSNWIKKSVETCGLTNIRIIRKVIKAVNRILGGGELSEALLARVVPSIVLLAAINYRGIEDGPDFQFVLAAGSPSDWGEILEDKNKELDEDGKRKAKWRLLVSELGILGCDEFEALVVDFLESGLFDPRKLTAIIDRYIAENDAMVAREKAHQFMKRLIWDHRLSENDLVTQAADLVTVAHLLDPYIASDLHLVLAPLSGGLDVGEAIVQGWLIGFRAQKHEDINDENPFNRPLHQAISAEFAAIKSRAQAKATVFEVCMHIIKHSGWGTMQEVAMKTATVADFETTIRTLEIEDLRAFMRRMLEMRIQRQTYDAHFGSATDRFTDACRNIVRDSKSERLGKLIQRLFDDAKIGSQMEFQSVAVAAVPVSAIDAPTRTQ